MSPSPLAIVLVSKFQLHQPLNRQCDAYAREGVEIDTSTLTDRVGACVVALEGTSKNSASLHRANQIQGSHALSAGGWHGAAWLLRFEPTL
jgi:transposase